MTMDLLSRHCTHLPEGTPPLAGEALDAYRGAVDTTGGSSPTTATWKPTFTFPDFAMALDFTNQVGPLAEAEDHHPEILLTWGKVSVRVWTHTVGG
jgi:4a-hydroxytetrahydrobiopterin dehydratase